MRLLVRHIVLLLALVGLPTMLCAQNATSSPYSAFGLGELNDNVPNTYRALGSVGIGMRNNKVINPMQPASYTSLDSLTFMFDVAAGVSWSRYSDASGMRNRANGNLEYLALQFPLWKRYIAFSAGLLPYVSKGYSITLSDSINSDYHYVTSFEGKGGISQVYGGLSFNICDWVALGANVYYMFGTSEDQRGLTFAEAGLSDVQQGTYFEVGTVRLRYGLQFFHTFGKHTIVLGGIFENKMPLHSNLFVYETNFEELAGDTAKNAFDMPLTYGVGLSYCWDNRLTVAADFMRQNWADAQYLRETNFFSNRAKYAFGVEYRHNPMGRNYAERMMWRIGANVVESYLPELKTPEFTVSMGFGFPLRTVGTIFNASVEYTRRGGGAMLEENTLKLTINASIAEHWFFKRKL